MKTLAVIGTGIAGMASAYLLKDRYKVTVYEKNAYVGGHTNTVRVIQGAETLPIDTGFMVYNDRTYPNLIRLFKRLGVASKETSMSFSVNDATAGFETKFSNLAGFFPTAATLLAPERYRLLSGMKKLFQRASDFIADESLPSMSLQEFAQTAEIPPIVVDRFLVPMAAAIWSTPSKSMLDYPARTLFRFLKNHGMLGFSDQFQWRTLEGGSQQYKDKILRSIGSSIKIGCAAVRLARRENGVEILSSDGETRRYDLAIVAAHADQALALLARPTDDEGQILSRFKYNVNPVALHTDASVMPTRRRAWASWNYRYDALDSGRHGSTHYWMNSLQGVSKTENYFVSVDYGGPLDESRVKWRFVYEHPRFDEAAIQAQSQLPRLNAAGPIYYCGSYFRYGFHEDALTAALEVCALLSDGKDPLA